MTRPLFNNVKNKGIFKFFFVTFSDMTGTLLSGTLSLIARPKGYLTYPLIPLGVKLKPYPNLTHHFLKGKTLGCPQVTLLKSRKSPYSQNIWTLLWHNRMYVVKAKSVIIFRVSFFYKISTLVLFSGQYAFNNCGQEFIRKDRRKELIY